MEKMLKYLFSTVQGSIIVGSILISLSILIGGGIIKIKGINPSVSTTTAAETQTGTQPAQPYTAFKTVIDQELGK